MFMGNICRTSYHRVYKPTSLVNIVLDEFSNYFFVVEVWEFVGLMVEI